MSNYSKASELTSLLVADNLMITGGSPDGIPGFSKVNGEYVDAIVEFASDSKGVLFPKVTTAARLAMIADNGMIVYDKDIRRFYLYEDDAWVKVDVGDGDVVGPNGAGRFNIPIFADTTGKVLADCGVSITQVPELDSYIGARKDLNINYSPLVDVNEMNEIGNIAFIDRGFIFVNDTYIATTYNFDSETSAICTVISDSVITAPSTFGSVFEVSSSTQAMTLPRLTQDAIDFLTSHTLTTPGQIMYNSTAGTFYCVTSASVTPFALAPKFIENDGSNSIYIGKNAGSNGIGTNNSSLGTDTLSSIDSGAQNSVFGSMSGTQITDGIGNSIFGYSSGTSLTTGSHNVILGDAAGISLDVNNGCVLIGNEAGSNNLAGEIIAIGQHSLGSYSGTDPSTIAIGADAAQSLVDGASSVFVGYNSGKFIDHGIGNTAVGLRTLYCHVGDVTVNYCTAMGYYASGGNNAPLGTSAFGYQAAMMSDQEHASSISAFGYSAARNNVDGSGVSAFGYNTLTLSTQNYNTAFGAYAGGNLLDGNANCIFGYSALGTLAHGSFHTVMGHQAANSFIFNSGVTAFGYQAIMNGGNGASLTAIGYLALTQGGDANYATALGYQALSSYIGGTDCTAAGYNSFVGLQNGDNNCGFGSNVALMVASGSNNAFFGAFAGHSPSSISESVLIGYNAGYSSASENLSQLVVIGSEAGSSILGSAGPTIIIGASAGGSLTSGIQNTLITSGGAAGLTSGSNNTIGGYQSLSIANASNCTTWGAETLTVACGNSNTAVGTQALVVCTGASNTALGSFAGDNYANVNSCTFLGFTANAAVNGLTNATAIGANAIVGASNNITLGDSTVPTSVSIGLNQAADGEILHILGEMAIQGYAEDNALAIGNYTRKGQYFARTTNSTDSHQFFLDITNLAFAAQIVNLQIVVIAEDGSSAAYATSDTGVWWNDVTLNHIAPSFPAIVVVNSSGSAFSASWSISASQVSLNLTSTNNARWVVNYEYIISCIQR